MCNTHFYKKYFTAEFYNEGKKFKNTTNLKFISKTNVDLMGGLTFTFYRMLIVIIMICMTIELCTVLCRKGSI